MRPGGGEPGGLGDETGTWRGPGSHLPEWGRPWAFQLQEVTRVFSQKLINPLQKYIIYCRIMSSTQKRVFYQIEKKTLLLSKLRIIWKEILGSEFFIWKNPQMCLLSLSEIWPFVVHKKYPIFKILLFHLRYLTFDVPGQSLKRRIQGSVKFAWVSIASYPARFI